MKGKEILRRSLPLVIIAVGVLGAWWLVANRPRAQREQVEPIPPLVQVVEARRTTERITIVAMGTVVPAKRVVLQPEVSGRIVAQSPQLLPGGLFRKGDVILRIDPRDYETAVKQQEAAVERARLEVETREGTTGDRGEGMEAARGGHLARSVQSGSGSAKTPTEECQTSRWKLPKARSSRPGFSSSGPRSTRPFNAVVQEEFVDEGQLVSPQTQLATLIGTDRFWVQVSVPGRPASLAHILQAPKHQAIRMSGSSRR